MSRSPDREIAASSGARAANGARMRRPLALLLAFATTLAACSSYPRRDPTGERFPTVRGEALDRTPVVLPDAGAGAPLLLGFILGPMLEEYLKRALKLARGDWSVFITRPLSAALLAVALLLVMMVLLPAIKSKREEAFVED